MNDRFTKRLRRTDCSRSGFMGAGSLLALMLAAATSPIAAGSDFMAWKEDPMTAERPHTPTEPRGLNVLGTPLKPCSTAPLTGYARDGFCSVVGQDAGVHGVCAVMDERFLQFTRAQGNDLITPRPEWRFPGLKPGDRWCVCAGRWQEALDAGVAPKVVLAATSEKVLDSLFLDDLLKHAVDAPAGLKQR